MKVELIEEVKFMRDPWYSVVLEGEVVFSTWNKSSCEDVYNAIIEGKISAETTRNILKSQEFSLPLDENNQENNNQSI